MVKATVICTSVLRFCFAYGIFSAARQRERKRGKLVTNCRQGQADVRENKKEPKNQKLVYKVCFIGSAHREQLKKNY